MEKTLFWYVNKKTRKPNTPLPPFFHPHYQELNMTMSYRFLADASTGFPLVLWMLGVNLYTGGHKDNYVATFTQYTPYPDTGVDPWPQGTFEAPVGLECVPATPNVAATVAAALNSVLSGLPSAHGGADPEYDAFFHSHGRRHRSEAEYHSRLAIFKDSKAFVEEWNSKPGGRHRVALNRFADWSHAEYRAVVASRTHGGSKQLLHSSSASSSSGPRRPLQVHNITIPPHMLPSTVIWRGTPADGPVKDQAACGSCWSFSAVAALEAAYYRAAGTRVPLSEQHMIDCAWPSPANNEGCYGGDQIRAFEWVLQQGGLAAAADVPYRGINDFCDKTAPLVQFTGQLVVVHGGEEATMEALLVKGPMSVSVDADDPAFKFYSEGVYYNPACHTKASELDHAVALSGYGTAGEDEGGVDYWLVKNIWSEYWGEGGYIRIARKGNDCGIATEPLYLDLQVSSSSS
jgi:hypothetical protein